MIRQILLVGIGGAAGSILRFLIAIVVSRWLPTAFPLGTFLINILGSFLIGVLASRFAAPADLGTRLLLVTGFCGGFTTFSTFSSENLTLLQNQQTALAFLNIIGSVVLGLGAAWLGLTIARN